MFGSHAALPPSAGLKMSSKTRVLFHGERFDVIEVDQPGTDGRTHRREVMQHPGAVVILPFVDEHQICLIRNLRVAVDATLIELPAGTREPDEPPAETARRELQEETGYLAGRMDEICQFYPSPGVMNEKMFLFAAHELVLGEHAREVGEQIENLVVPFEEALQMVRRGEIKDGKTMIGLLLWSELHPRHKNAFTKA
jgi:ADP-ribose pyrophosphatase